jgi:hypothetical protein
MWTGDITRERKLNLWEVVTSNGGEKEYTEAIRLFKEGLVDSRQLELTISDIEAGILTIGKHGPIAYRSVYFADRGKYDQELKAEYFDYLDHLATIESSILKEVRFCTRFQCSGMLFDYCVSGFRNGRVGLDTLNIILRSLGDMNIPQKHTCSLIIVTLVEEGLLDKEYYLSADFSTNAMLVSMIQAYYGELMTECDRSICVSVLCGSFLLNNRFRFERYIEIMVSEYEDDPEFPLSQLYNISRDVGPGTISNTHVKVLRILVKVLDIDVAEYLAVPGTTNEKMWAQEAVREAFNEQI